MELMAQLDAQIPQPLREDLPKLLSSRAMRTPAVRVLLTVLIGQNGLKTPAAKRESQDICRQKAILGPGGKEEFVDDPLDGLANRTLGAPGWVGRHNDPAARPRHREHHLRQIEELAKGPGFGVHRLLIGGPAQQGFGVYPIVLNN
jgi:hypothetical protein